MDCFRIAPETHYTAAELAAGAALHAAMVREARAALAEALQRRDAGLTLLSA